MTANPAALELRAALVALLKADAPLLALLGGPRVFDHVPEGLTRKSGGGRDVRPYIQIRTSERAWDTSTEWGKTHIVELNVWSEAEGRRECDLVMGALETALREVELSMPGHVLVNFRFQMGDVIREEGGQSYFGYMKFRAVTEEN